MRVAVVITLTADERRVLGRGSRSRAVPARLGVRAKMILMAAEGRSNEQMAEALKVGRANVGRWRNRFAESRLPGIEHERPGRGRRPTR